MATVQNTKSLSSRTVETMRLGDKIKADTGENIGLRVQCGGYRIKDIFLSLYQPDHIKACSGENRQLPGDLPDRSEIEAPGTETNSLPGAFSGN
jgi:hypothetical protein